MAEPLKNSFGHDIPVRIGDAIAAVWPDFDADGFVGRCRSGYDDLELTERAHHIADVMAEFLPSDRGQAIEILIASLSELRPGADGDTMAGFVFLPHSSFVATHGLDHFEASMRALREITVRFTAEFGIRPFLAEHPKRTLDQLRHWALDPDERVRRLVSEGTRPRLPWAPRLPEFQADPTPVLALLEQLKDDPSSSVRRSVANNLNDIAKDHPDVVVELASRWWADGGSERRALVRHGLRTLVKQGHSGALAVLGFDRQSPARPGEVTIDPSVVTIGGRVVIEAVIENPGADETAALVDLRVWFVKAGGSTSPKVFKGAELQLGPGEFAIVRKTISLRQHSTRTHHPGEHVVELLVNGAAFPAGSFQLEAAPVNNGVRS